MIIKRFKLQRKDIALVQFLIEGYEGLATVTTIDSRQAAIQISIMPDFVQEVTGIINNLGEKFKIKEIADLNP